MNTWHLYGYDTRRFVESEERIAWGIKPVVGGGGYSVKLLRDIHRALLALSPEDYAEVRKMLEGEEELYE